MMRVFLRDLRIVPFACNHSKLRELCATCLGVCIAEKECEERTTFPEFYFETLFAVARRDILWPDEFAIITAYAPTGIEWSAEANQAANERLLVDIASSRHNEQGWAIQLGVDSSCKLGQKFHQHAISFVRGDQLLFCLCEQPNTGAFVGKFRDRVRCLPKVTGS